MHVLIIFHKMLVSQLYPPLPPERVWAMAPGSNRWNKCWYAGKWQQKTIRHCPCHFMKGRDKAGNIRISLKVVSLLPLRHSILPTSTNIILKQRTHSGQHQSQPWSTSFSTGVCHSNPKKTRVQVSSSQPCCQVAADLSLGNHGIHRYTSPGWHPNDVRWVWLKIMVPMTHRNHHV